MTPYLTAFEAYHAGGPPDVPWSAALDFHLQAGVVHSSPAAFLMARPVDPLAPAHLQASLHRFPEADCYGWHVWMAAGSREAMAILAEHYITDPFMPVTFLRLGSPRLRSMSFSRLAGRF